MPAVQETIDAVKSLDVDKYKYGFTSDIESDKAPRGLSEDTIRFGGWPGYSSGRAMRLTQTVSKPKAWAPAMSQRFDEQNTISPGGRSKASTANR